MPAALLRIGMCAGVRFRRDGLKPSMRLLFGEGSTDERVIAV